MFKEIKKLLLLQIDVLCSLLEYFGFCHINYKQHEIRFARNEEGGQNISIRLENNDGLLVKDFVKGTCCDVFAFIMNERGIQLRDVMAKCKELLNLDTDWAPRKQVSLFGGVFDHIIEHRESVPLTTYDESILDQFDMKCNKRWYKDGISYEAQRFYDVGYDVVTNRIIFPWRDQFGNIIAVKGRLNEDVIPDDVPKYLYVVNGPHSQALYNYSECYGALNNNDVYVFEAEKSVQKLYTWGIKNSVALGNSSISDEQCKLLLQLQPRTVYFMLDKNLDLAETRRNIDKLKSHMVTFSNTLINDVKIKFWNWEYNLTLDDKSAPCDGTKEVWDDILSEEIEDEKDLVIQENIDEQQMEY